MPRVEKKCEYCEQTFSSYQCDNRKYCSMKCKNLAQSSRMIGNTYRVGIPSWNKGRKATEQEKNILRKIKRPSGKNHPMYGKKHSEAVRNKISERIKDKIPKGENHWNWKGGKSRGYKTGYYSQKYINWRKSVFERDLYTCRVCGKNGGYLTAHHIKSFAHFPELRFDINNGLTLCEKCHEKTDNYKGRGINK